MKKAYLRATFKSHANNGKLNVARKLVRVMYAMLIHGEDWNIEKLEASRV